MLKKMFVDRLPPDNIFIPVPGVKELAVNSLGEVHYLFDGKILKPVKEYRIWGRVEEVVFYRSYEGKVTKAVIGMLVLMVFHGKPKNKSYLQNYIDGDYTNHSPHNLEYIIVSKLTYNEKMKAYSIFKKPVYCYFILSDLLVRYDTLLDLIKVIDKHLTEIRVALYKSKRIQFGEYHISFAEDGVPESLPTMEEAGIVDYGHRINNHDPSQKYPFRNE